MHCLNYKILILTCKCMQLIGIRDLSLCQLLYTPILYNNHLINVRQLLLDCIL